jgi:hypothetical protein
MPWSGSLVVWRATHAVRAANRQRRRELERELAHYRTGAECDDLAATLDRHPDGVTAEIREILAHQRLWGRSGTFPGFGSG